MITLLAAVFACAPATNDTGAIGADATDTEVIDAQAIEAAIEALRASVDAPGLGYALAVDGAVALAGGVGLSDVERGVEVTQDTPFLLASISKTFTGASMLQAIEADAFTLEDPINDLLPFAVDNPRVEGEVIRVVDLVTHGSGIRDDWVWGAPGGQGLYVDGDSPIGLGEFLEGYLVEGGAWYDAQANFAATAPGERYSYSNVAAALGGHLLETTTGEPLDEHAMRHLFEPLGLTHTGWRLADFDDPDLIAMPYLVQSDGYAAFGHYGYPDYPDGLLRSSPADLGRFMAMMQGGGALDGARVLEASSVAAALADAAGFAGQGVFWYRYPRWGEMAACHSGSDYGVSTDLCLALGSRIGVAVTVNGHGVTDIYGAIAEVEELLYEAGRALLSARAAR